MRPGFAGARAAVCSGVLWLEDCMEAGLGETSDVVGPLHHPPESAGFDKLLQLVHRFHIANDLQKDL